MGNPLDELTGIFCQNRALTKVHEDLGNENNHLLDSILDIVKLLSPAFPELVNFDEVHKGLFDGFAGVLLPVAAVVELVTQVNV